MRGERPLPLVESVRERIVAFTRIGHERGINSFIIKGPTPDTPTDFHTFVALFPFPGGYNLIFSGVEGERNTTYKKVTTLELPERVRNLERQDIELLREAMEEECELQGLPSIVVGFGDTIENKEEVNVLFFIAGMSSQTALQEIRKYSALRLKRLVRESN